MKNYYKILGIPNTASDSEIKNSFRKLAKKFHPDANPGNSKAEEVFKEVNEAYSILGDKISKDKYDRELNLNPDSKQQKETQNNKKNTTQSSNSYTNMKDIDFENINKSFESFFGFNPKGDGSDFKPKSKKSKDNPLNTSAMFEKFFGGK